MGLAWAPSTSDDSKHAPEGTIWCVPNGSFSSNCYIGKTDAPGECIVIDPGLDGNLVNTRLHQLKLRPRWIFCTHGHFDHCGSAAQLQRTYDAPVFMHAADEKTMKASNFMLMALHLPDRIEMPKVNFITDGFAVEAGATLRFLATPGHTPGSCLIRWGKAIFSGDTLYARGVGLSGLPGEDHKRLRQSILKYWDGLPGDCMLYPGHGRIALLENVHTGNIELRTFLGLNTEQKGDSLPCSQPAGSRSPA
jgi:glyoxylase-like metal-dependent hydrolase (beta-lactamase superfamily II)